MRRSHLPTIDRDIKDKIKFLSMSVAEVLQQNGVGNNSTPLSCCSAGGGNSPYLSDLLNAEQNALILSCKGQRKPDTFVSTGPFRINSLRNAGSRPSAVFVSTSSTAGTQRSPNQGQAQKKKAWFRREPSPHIMRQSRTKELLGRRACELAMQDPEVAQRFACNYRKTFFG
jgi:hypothetical protein